jgi:MoaA/NifB/PqqE/SkfB family radical SAM enzyme
MKGLSIHLTDQCNNSCRFCVVDSHQGCTEKVNLGVVFKFLENNSKKGYELVNIHGGEPTIVPEIVQILDKIRGLGYPGVSIQTNGRLLKDIAFAETLASKGVNLFVISLHGKDAEVHDYCTAVEGSFDEAVQGIKNLKALGIKVRTNTVVCKRNQDTIRDIVSLSMDLGTDHINISSIHPVGKAYKNFKEVTPRVTDTMPDVIKAVDAVVSRNAVITLEGFPPCILGDYSKYMIDWDEIQYKLLFRNMILANYDEFMKNDTRICGEPCKKCLHVEKCGGVYKEYLEFYDWSEFSPVLRVV